MDGDGLGMGTDVMGMGWDGEKLVGDRVGMGRTSCPRAAL